MAQFPHEVWKTMSTKDLRQFATAVFFLFAPIGPLSLLMEETIIPASWVRLAIMTVLCGAFSWSIVMAYNRPLRLILAIVIYVVLIFSMSLFTPEFLEPDVPKIEVKTGVPFSLTAEQLSDVQLKRSVFGITAMFCIAVGYALFVRTYAKESRRRVEVEAEVRLAQTIHESLLPKGSLTMPWCDAAGMSIPATQIGGDFYDLIRVSDDRILAVVADASGHGTGAGILSAMTKSGIIQELKHTQDPSTLLANVNTTIHGVTKKNMFVTCAVVLCDRSTMTAVLVTAGHPPILRYSASTGSVEEFRTHNLALGIASASVFESITIPYQPGDCFCLITDGLSETNNASQEQFGMERIKTTLRQQAEHPHTADTISASLISNATQFTGRGLLNDDITTLIVRII